MQMKHMYGLLGHVDEYTRSVPIIASTPNPVEGEALTSWDLSRFLKGPVVLWSHESENLPIGVAEEVEFDPAVGLKMKVRFARKEANPLAEQVYQGVRDGIVRAVSVGYDYGDAGNAEKEEAQPDAPDAPAAGRMVRLLEVSFVTIGMDEDAGTALLNPDADDSAEEQAESPADEVDENFEGLPEEERARRVRRAAATLAVHRAVVRRSLARALLMRSKPAVEERTDAKGPTVKNPSVAHAASAKAAELTKKAEDLDKAHGATGSPKALKAHAAAKEAHAKAAQKWSSHASYLGGGFNNHANAKAAEHTKAGRAHGDIVQAAADGAKPRPEGGHPASAHAHELSKVADAATAKAGKTGASADHIAASAHHAAASDAHAVAADHAADKNDSRLAQEHQTKMNDHKFEAHQQIAKSHGAKFKEDQAKEKAASAKGGGDGAHPDERSRDENGRFDGEQLEEGFVLRMDRAPIRLDNLEQTPVGGHKIPARLSRTGILTYLNPDGTKRRELRLAEEVFKADSMATLEDAPVIDITHHTGMITPQTWKVAALGHTRSVHRDGEFLSGTLAIDHHDAIEQISSGDRIEISCGYRCRLDMTPGTWNGQQYDCVQRNIRYNHVALCPPSRGRAGPEVGLRLDAKAPAWGVSHYEEEDEIMKVVRIDGKDYTFGSEEHIAKLEADAKLKVDDLQKRLDAAEGARDAAQKELEQVRTDAKEKVKDADKEKEERKAAVANAVKSRVRLFQRFLRFFGNEEDDEEDDEDDDKKKDKKSEKLDSMTDREIHVMAIKKRDPDFNDTGKSDDYVQARFDAICDMLAKDRGVNGVVKKAENELHRLDARDAASGGKDPIAEARKKRDVAFGDAWKGQNAGK
jgi:HK97 family phage prohead protease